MQLISQLCLLRTFADKHLHALQLVDASRFETTGIVKTKTHVAPKDHFVLDVMGSALEALVWVRGGRMTSYLCGRSQYGRIDLTMAVSF